MIRLFVPGFMKLVNDIALCIGDAGLVAEDLPFRAGDQLVYFAHGAFLMPALAVENSAVGIVELYAMMVKDLTIFFSFSYFTAAHALRRDGISVQGPVDDVQVMDMLFEDVVAA